MVTGQLISGIRHKRTLVWSIRQNKLHEFISRVSLNIEFGGDQLF
jgi:hypothetical protein